MLRYSTRFKIWLVERMARRFGIPISVHEEALPEVRRALIDKYIAECSYLLEHVYDADNSQVWKFEDYAYDHMLADHSPFLLHEHPLYYTAVWLGEKAPNLAESERRFKELVENDEYYQGAFKDGWRVMFGHGAKDKPVSGA